MEFALIVGMLMIAYAVGTNRNKLALLIRVHELQDEFMYESRHRIEKLEDKIIKMKEADKW